MGSTRPLREFVYLDEVSLRSLLVSQRDTIPEQISRAMTQADEAEVNSKISGGSDLVAKAEVGSRFKTSNSNSVQSSRKAIVQTLFNELREDSNPKYSLAISGDGHEPLDDILSVNKIEDPAKAAPVDTLVRGTLVEVEVELEVDPVFKFGTQISEYSAMSDEYPDMFDGPTRAMLASAAPVNKVLNRFLAGLIPIRAKAVDLSVIEVGGAEYVVHNALIEGLPIERRILEVVGVTEHLGYWKDIRRVLFSSARVTMLCRVARDGLHREWTPIKLADLFRDVAPDLVAQLDAASRSGIEARPDPRPSVLLEPFTEAMRLYRQRLEEVAGVELGEEELESLSEALGRLGGDTSASTQRIAFTLVRERIEERAGGGPLLDPQSDLVARQEARDGAGLALFAGISASGTPADTAATTSELRHNDDDRLLDVEVVAIYW